MSSKNVTVPSQADGGRKTGVTAGDGWGERVAAAVTDMRVARPVTWTVFVMAAVVGVLTDLALHASDVYLTSRATVASRRLLERRTGHSVAVSDTCSKRRQVSSPT